MLPDLNNRETVLISSQRRKPDAFDLANDDDDLGFKPFSFLSETDATESREVRFSVDDWLSGTDRALIVGAAGSGKTTLLRYIILDLLSQDPTLPAIAERLGRHLPVWIPFAYWTHTLQRQPQASIVDVLRSWFHSWGEDQLFSLVEEAIADERLLLVVDGLDEWVDEPTGSLAFAQLERFLDMRRLPAFAAARPYALNWIKLSGDWRIARIAMLSSRQREAICDIWFKLMTPSSDLGDGLRAIQHEMGSLIADFDRSSDLDELSRVPLFLLLLITLRLQGAALPGGRFDAYAAIIQHMLRDHPQRKRTAAAIIPTDQLSEREIQTVLARLAFEIQTRQSGGTISEDDFLRLLLEVLMSQEGAGLGLSNTDARKVAKGFINIEEGTLGLLVPQGLRTFGFLHRSFQERLTAIHCANLTLDAQTKIVQQYCGDPQWRETLLHLCSLTPRPDELSLLLSAFPDSAVGSYAREGFEEFRTEVAFSDFTLPLQQIREIANSAFDLIEHSTNLDLRRRILQLCLNGMQARRTRELVQPKLDQWCIAHGTWRSNWLSQLDRWPADELTRLTALRALNDEDDYVVREAAISLSKVFSSNSQVIDDLVRRAHNAFSVGQRAACIEALVRVVPNHPEMHSMCIAAKDTDVPLLQLLGLYATAMRESVSQEDAVMAIDLASDGVGGPLPYQWKDLVGPLLAKVAKSNWEMVKQACLHAVEESFYGYPSNSESVDRDTAWFVLATVYHGEADVQRAFEMEMKKEHAFISMNRRDIWKVIASSFKGVEKLMASVDAKLETFNSAFPSEAHYAALLTRSDKAKLKMLQMLQDSFPHWAATALLEGWGMKDDEVAFALRNAVSGSPHRAAELGHLIPKILGTSAGNLRLLELVAHPDIYRLDLVIEGLAQDTENKNDEVLIEKVIKAVEATESFRDQNIAALIRWYPEDPRIRSFALKDLRSREPAIGTLAAAYPNDPEIRPLLASLMTPLATSLRSEAASSLSRVGPLSEQSEWILSHWDAEGDSAVKTKMSIGYHSHLMRSHSSQTKAIEGLTSAAKSYGPDHDARRQAAFCGATLLKQFQIYFENKERIGEPTGLAIPLERGLRSNYPFLDFVALHWSEIKAAFGKDDLLVRFSRFSSDTSAWTTLLSVAHQNAEMTSDAEEALASNAHLSVSVQGLRFLAKTKPRSIQLRQAALSAINSSGGSWMDFLPMDAACDILLEQFKDERLRVELENLAGQHLGTVGPQLTLCLGWPESSSVQSLLPRLNNVNQLVAAHAFFSAETSDKIVSRLPDQLHRAAHDSFWGRYIRRPVMARLQRDAELSSKLYEDLLNKPTAWKTCAYPHAIARTQGLSSSARDWVIAEYDRQLSLSRSEFGYDLIFGGVRAVVHSLRDSLHQ